MKAAEVWAISLSLLHVPSDLTSHTQGVQVQSGIIEGDAVLIISSFLPPSLPPFLRGGMCEVMAAVVGYTVM